VFEEAQKAWNSPGYDSPGTAFGLEMDPIALILGKKGLGKKYRSLINKSGYYANKVMAKAGEPMYSLARKNTPGRKDGNELDKTLDFAEKKPASTTGMLAALYFGSSAIGSMGGGGASGGAGGAGGGASGGTGEGLGIFSNNGAAGMDSVGGGNMGNLVAQQGGGAASASGTSWQDQLRQQQMPQQQQQQEQQRQARSAYTPATVPTTGGVGERPDPIGYRRLMMARAMGA
jgi:hypothetical protein